MNRRTALSALFAAAFARPSLAQSRVKRIGYLSQDDDGSGLLSRLAQKGHVKGRDLEIEVRAVGYDRALMAAGAAELVRSKVDVLVAFGDPRTRALANATRSIPIVCIVSDPIGFGLAESLGRPGRNVTGLALGGADVAPVEVALHRTLLPRLSRMILAVPTWRGELPVQAPYAETFKAAGISLEQRHIANPGDCERLFTSFRDPATGVVRLFLWPGFPKPEPLREITALGIRHHVATVSGAGATHMGAKMVRQGVLMHYGREFADNDDRIAALLDKVLRGANPAEIPFEVPDRTVFALNRTTASALGLRVPPEMLARATEVID